MSEREANSLNPSVEHIIGQYRRVVGKLDEMFVEISRRTEWEAWRFDGVGSCGIPKERSEIGLSGIAKDKLIALREERNRQNNLERIKSRYICPYHRKDFGCGLGDLKSPICIAYVENKDEVQEKFGIDPADFYSYIRSGLDRILLEDPNQNDDFVDEMVEKIEALISHIKSFPILTGLKIIPFEEMNLMIGESN